MQMSENRDSSEGVQIGDFLFWSGVLKDYLLGQDGFAGARRPTDDIHRVFGDAAIENQIKALPSPP